MLLLIFVIIADTKYREFLRFGPNTLLDMVGTTAFTAVIAGEAALFRVPISSDDAGCPVFETFAQRVEFVLRFR